MTAETIVTDYERTLRFNPITRLLHANKYKLYQRDLRRLIDEAELPRDRAIRVLDLGCGPASGFTATRDVLDSFTYVGIDPDPDLVAAGEANFGSDSRFKVIHGHGEDHLSALGTFDVILSFDTFEHMPLNVRMRNLELLGQQHFQRLYVNVPNEVGPAILIKNTGSALMGYKRHTEYSFGETLRAGFYQTDKIDVHINAHKGFDWRHLHTGLRFYFKTDVKTSPVTFLPRAVSPSIFMVCRPYRDGERRI